MGAKITNTKKNEKIKPEQKRPKLFVNKEMKVETGHKEQQRAKNGGGVCIV